VSKKTCRRAKPSTLITWKRRKGGGGWTAAQFPYTRTHTYSHTHMHTNEKRAQGLKATLKVMKEREVEPRSHSAGARLPFSRKASSRSPLLTTPDCAEPPRTLSTHSSRKTQTNTSPRRFLISFKPQAQSTVHPFAQSLCTQVRSSCKDCNRYMTCRGY